MKSIGDKAETALAKAKESNEVIPQVFWFLRYYGFNDIHFEYGVFETAPERGSMEPRHLGMWRATLRRIRMDTMEETDSIEVRKVEYDDMMGEVFRRLYVRQKTVRIQENKATERTP